jgi:hypothetical protein
MRKIIKRYELERQLIYAKYNKKFLTYLFLKLKLWKENGYGQL